jgi:hypothetical protein
MHVATAARSDLLGYCGAPAENPLWRPRKREVVDP